jgi:hypothetical protein
MSKWIRAIGGSVERKRQLGSLIATAYLPSVGRWFMMLPVINGAYPADHEPCPIRTGSKTSLRVARLAADIALMDIRTVVCTGRPLA